MEAARVQVYSHNDTNAANALVAGCGVGSCCAWEVPERQRSSFQELARIIGNEELDFQ